MDWTSSRIVWNKFEDETQTNGWNGGQAMNEKKKVWSISSRRLPQRFILGEHHVSP